MIHYLNNCQNYDHAKAYSHVCSDAFFDLYTTGRDATYILALVPGDECVVATKASKEKSRDEPSRGMVVFSRYRLDRTVGGQFLSQIPTLVLCGTLLSRETMTKAEAAVSSKYALFFNVKGHFKQLSVLRDA